MMEKKYNSPLEGGKKPRGRSYVNKKAILLGLSLILLLNGTLACESDISKPAGSKEMGQTQPLNSEANKVLPTCEELNITQEQIDEAVAEAIIDINDPWGNKKDFQLLMDRIEAELHCTLQNPTDASSARALQEVLPLQSETCELSELRDGVSLISFSFANFSSRLMACETEGRDIPKCLANFFPLMPS